MVGPSNDLPAVYLCRGAIDLRIGSTEGCKVKSGANNGIKSVKKKAVILGRYDVFEGKSGKWYFNLKAGNQQVILSSEGYSSKQGAKSGTDSVERNEPGARRCFKRPVLKADLFATRRLLSYSGIKIGDTLGL